MGDNIGSQARLIDAYDSIEGTINNGASDTSVFAIGTSNLTSGLYLSIANDDGANDFTVKLNADTNDSFTVKAGEVLTISPMQITAIFLSNASGGNIAYRILVVGEDNQE